MTAILLDTHVWIWYVVGEKELQAKTRTMIATALHENEAYLAAISVWEIAMLNKKQRITLGMPCLDWIKKSLDLTHAKIVPLTPDISVESINLPGKFHEDPADRMIVATARVEDLTIVTRDKNILNYSRNKYVSAVKA